jgi:hypothetical protein
MEVPITPILPERVVLAALIAAGFITPKTGRDIMEETVSRATEVAVLQAITMIVAPCCRRKVAFSMEYRVIVEMLFGPYGNLDVSPKYTNEAPGSFSASVFTTVNPPIPESKTPITGGEVKELLMDFARAVVGLDELSSL